MYNSICDQLSIVCRLHKDYSSVTRKTLSFLISHMCKSINYLIMFFLIMELFFYTTQVFILIIGESYNININSLQHILQCTTDPSHTLNSIP